MDRAIRANVLVNALDAAALYRYSRYHSLGHQLPYGDGAAQMERETNRRDLGRRDGGTGRRHRCYFFKNKTIWMPASPAWPTARNTTTARLLAAESEDGRQLPRLKVTLKSIKDVSANAAHRATTRRGTWRTPSKPPSANRRGAFSREEMSDIPLELHTSSSKWRGQSAGRAGHQVGGERPQIPQGNDRNCNELTVVAGLFDRNGVYSTGNQKKIEMKLLDETVETLGAGLTIRPVSSQNRVPIPSVSQGFRRAVDVGPPERAVESY